MLINNNFSSPNYSVRDKNIEYIMVHFTEMTFEDAFNRLLDRESKVSAHYLIKQDGEIFQLVLDENVAWHSGISSWYGMDALNKNSIGIELDNLGDHRFTDAQMQSCITLSQSLMKKYNILQENFIAHSDVAPNRKIDPGIYFDWRLCAKNGLGIWHDLAAPADAEKLLIFGDNGEKVNKLQRSLKKLGYAIEITGEFDMQTNFVIRAFKSKFYPESIHKEGIEFYKNDQSLYSWDSFSELIIQKLLGE